LILDQLNPTSGTALPSVSCDEIATGVAFDIIIGVSEFLALMILTRMWHINLTCLTL